MLEGPTKSQNDPINFLFTNIATHFGGIYDFRTNGPKKHYDLFKKLIESFQLNNLTNEGR
jgi:hypothetical protein